MTHFPLPTLFLALMCLLPAAPASAEYPGEHELAIEVALTPKTGFDDNDTVQVIVRGVLPDLCHRLGKNTVRVDEESKSITIRQFMMAEKSGICEERYPRADYTKMQVPFQAEIQIGVLKPGNYTLKYNVGLAGGTKKRDMKIDVAAIANIDNLSYATVTSINMADVSTPADFVTAEIQGILNSNCVEIDSFKVEPQDDVFIVLPTVKESHPGQPCVQMIRPFKQTIRIGRQDSGHYLLHVRSTGGRALNRLFEVRN